jgi:hypothetical protein
VKEILAMVDLDEGTPIETWAGRDMLTYLSPAITSRVATIRILHMR